MDEPVPPVVAQALAEQRRWTLTRTVPVFAYLLASVVVLPLVMPHVADAVRSALVGGWMAGALAAAGTLVAGAPERRRRERIIDEWRRRTIARDIAGHPEPSSVDPLDALVERVVALVDGEDRKAVVAARDRARTLRADAARARSAAGALPAGGEGSRALTEAADRAEAEAAALDDRLAALYAELVSPARSGEAERMAARREVEQAARGTRPLQRE